MCCQLQRVVGVFRSWLTAISWLGLVTPAIAMATISADRPLSQALPDLRAASRAARVMFVEVAVEALSERFLAAAKMSHDDPAWSQRTRTYVSELWRVVDAAHAGGEVVLIEDPGGSLRVVVRADPPRQFGLVPPHPQERAQVEATVMVRFCQRIDCQTLPRALQQATSDAGSATIGRAAPGQRQQDLADLDIGMAGLACKQDGQRHARLHEMACRKVLAEVRELLEVLHRSAAGGLRLDWSLLERALWRVSGRLLEINGDGQVVELSAPLLGRFPQLMIDAMPWIQARLTGSVRQQVLRPPARLIYALAHDSHD